MAGPKNPKKIHQNNQSINELASGKIEPRKPHISWENRWFPVEIFPYTNPLMDGIGAFK
jgi:hypothetical protein